LAFFFGTLTTESGISTASSSMNWLRRRFFPLRRLARRSSNICSYFPLRILFFTSEASWNGLKGMVRFFLYSQLNDETTPSWLKQDNKPMQVKVSSPAILLLREQRTVIQHQDFTLARTTDGRRSSASPLTADQKIAIAQLR
jgi:hypothetical protein